MIALTAGRRKGVVNTKETARNHPTLPETSIHGIVSGILLLPHFRQPPAPLGCDKKILRWPGPFGSGFLSPQPPGAVGIGPVRSGSYSRYWANESWSFFVCGDGPNDKRHQPPFQDASNASTDVPIRET
jgi:hypothetical protein